MEKEKLQEKIIYKNQTLKSLIFEFMRFLLVGGLATLIDWLVSFIFAAILPDWFIGNMNVKDAIISTALGFTVGLFINYFLSIIFVYKNKEKEESGKSLNDFIKFAVIGVLVLLFQMLLIYLMNDLLFIKLLNFTATCVGNLTWGYIISRALATGIGLILNYIFRKIIIFK